MDDEILVSREMLKAIGADTRISILKALKERQKTQSELAREMKLAAPTILDHMNKLEEAGLIERVPEDRERKWKYYRLTETAEKMLGKKKMSIIMVLASSSFILTAGLALFYIFAPLLISFLAGGPVTAAPQPVSSGGATGISSALTSLESSSQSFLGVLVMLFLLISVVLGLAALWKRR